MHLVGYLYEDVFVFLKISGYSTHCAAQTLFSSLHIKQVDIKQNVSSHESYVLFVARD
jgi:hypothetical protein